MVSLSFGQVTVTNPANTTPNLAATYTSLANAITALSGITSISGPVIITLDAGNPQTAPAGGYVIQFTATTTAANNITIAGTNNIITAFAPQTTGNINDAIFNSLVPTILRSRILPCRKVLPIQLIRRLHQTI